MDEIEVDKEIHMNGDFGRAVFLTYADIGSLSTAEQLEHLFFAIDSAWMLVSDEIRFHSMDVLLCCSDEFTGTPGSGEMEHPYWLLLDSSRPEFIQPEDIRINQQRKEVDVFDQNALKQEIKDLFNQSTFACEDGNFPGWSSVEFRSSTVRIDEDLVVNDFLPVNYNGGHAIYQYPIVRDHSGVWAGGRIPYDKVEPLSIHISNLGWELNCRVQLNWSYLYESNPSITEFIDQLVAKGWKLETAYSQSIVK